MNKSPSFQTNLKNSGFDERTDNELEVLWPIIWFFQKKVEEHGYISELGLWFFFETQLGILIKPPP